MSSSVVIFAALFGLAVGQFGPRPFARPAFGRFGNPNVLHNSYHRPFPSANSNPMNGQNGGMFGGSNSFGGMGGGAAAGAQGLGAGAGANMFGPGGRMPRDGVCPMLQGVTDMQAFKTTCLTLMQTAPQDAECTPGPWGNQCPSGTKCCPTAVDGACQLKCSIPILSPVRVGTCPTGFYDKPTPGMGWIGGMCFYAKSIGQAWEPECRFDGDCPDSQKCCSPNIDPTNLFATCVRKCTKID